MAKAGSTRVFIVAGEASGDVLGAALMRSLKSQSKSPVAFAGIGGQDMVAAGLSSLFPMSELSVMGLLEVIPHIKRLKARIHEAAQAALAFKPDVIITIDSPGFAHRFIDALGPVAALKVHYVAPSVWAWKPKRVYKFKARYDLLLTLLPFEPPYFTRVGLETHFVGHPVTARNLVALSKIEAREALGLEPGTGPVLTLMPGSRKGEVARLIPIFKDVVSKTVHEIGSLTTLIPTLPHLQERMAEATLDWPGPFRLITNSEDRYKAMRAADAALIASGTASIEMAAAGTPMLVAYRMNPITHFIVRRMVKIDYVSIINLLAVFEKRSPPIPEFLQNECRVDLLSQALPSLFKEEGRRQSDALLKEIEALKGPGGKDPSYIAAESILDALTAR